MDTNAEIFQENNKLKALLLAQSHASELEIQKSREELKGYIKKIWSNFALPEGDLDEFGFDIPPPFNPMTTLLNFNLDYLDKMPPNELLFLRDLKNNLKKIKVVSEEDMISSDPCDFIFDLKGNIVLVYER